MDIGSRVQTNIFGRTQHGQIIGLDEHGSASVRLDDYSLATVPLAALRPELVGKPAIVIYRDSDSDLAWDTNIEGLTVVVVDNGRANLDDEDEAAEWAESQATWGLDLPPSMRRMHLEQVRNELIDRRKHSPEDVDRWLLGMSR